jgi:hypothetical protein
METCKACGSQYDSANVQIPSPIPDGVCGQCGTELSQERLDQILTTSTENKE